MYSHRWFPDPIASSLTEESSFSSEQEAFAKNEDRKLWTKAKLCKSRAGEDISLESEKNQLTE